VCVCGGGGGRDNAAITLRIVWTRNRAVPEAGLAKKIWSCAFKIVPAQTGETSVAS
jgi:hypothetical protein